MNRVFVEMSFIRSETGIESTRPGLDGRPSIFRESSLRSSEGRISSWTSARPAGRRIWQTWRCFRTPRTRA